MATPHQPPSVAEPLTRAILDLLCRLPLHWKAIDYETLTGTEQKALTLMMRGGLVEERLSVRASTKGFPQEVQARFRVTGEWDNKELLRRLLEAVPEWVDSDRRMPGGLHLETSGVVEVRLTDQGELARHYYETQTPEKPSVASAFVRKAGFFALRPPVQGAVVLESCRVEKDKADSPAGLGNKGPADGPAPLSLAGDADHMIPLPDAATLTAAGVAQERVDSQAPAGARPRGLDNKTVPVSAWRAVQGRLLKICQQGELYTSVRELAPRVGCSPGTVSKAVNRSHELRTWKAQKTKGQPNAQSLAALVIESRACDAADAADMLPDDEVDRMMKMLIAQAPPAERPKLVAMDKEARRRLVKLAGEQAQDQFNENYAPKGNRTLGRKP